MHCQTCQQLRCAAAATASVASAAWVVQYCCAGEACSRDVGCELLSVKRTVRCVAATAALSVG
jgi:hypothetical protein